MKIILALLFPIALFSQQPDTLVYYTQNDYIKLVDSVNKLNDLNASQAEMLEYFFIEGNDYYFSLYRDNFELTFGNSDGTNRGVLTVSDTIINLKLNE